MANLFLTPKQIFNGSNALQEAMVAVKSCGKKAFIVTDNTMVQLGNIDTLTKLLAESGIEYSIFPEINQEPNDEMIAAGVKAFEEKKCDFFIAMGGGSPMDAMKAIAVMIGEEKNLNEFMGQMIEKELPAMVAIPTTSGTGSEATMFTIISDLKNGVKMLLKGSCLIPGMAIIDPQFTMSVPPHITSSTGIDALCHAIEAYTSRKAQPLSDTFALSAIDRIFQYLPVAYKEPQNEEARIQMSLASLEAGIAFNNASVTIVHGMSRPIGALYHVPHGLSNAILLEGCMSFALEGAYDRFANVARTCGVSMSACDETAAKDLLAYLKEFLNGLDVPKLSEIKVDLEAFKSSIDKMATDALISGSPANTMREVTKEDIVAIYNDLCTK